MQEHMLVSITNMLVVYALIHLPGRLLLCSMDYTSVQLLPDNKAHAMLHVESCLTQRPHSLLLSGMQAQKIHAHTQNSQ